MMRAWLFIIALMLSPLAAQAAETPKACDISVQFGSYCCGTDFNTYKTVKGILEASKISWRRLPWGLEGEFTMCVDARSDAEIEPLYNKIKAVLPPAGDKMRGYTTIHIKDEDEK